MKRQANGEHSTKCTAWRIGGAQYSEEMQETKEKSETKRSRCVTLNCVNGKSEEMNVYV